MVAARLRLPSFTFIFALGCSLIALLAAGPALAQTGSFPSGAVNVGSVAVNTGTPSQVTLIFTFATGGTVAAPAVVTEGAANLDFTDTGTGTCSTNGTSHSYNAKDTCTVDVNFAPIHAGPRYGAVVLDDTSGEPIATGYIYGAGTGPQMSFLPGAESTVPTPGLSSPTSPNGSVVDAAGNIYIGDWNNGRVLKETAANGSYTQSVVVTGVTQTTGVAIDGAGNLYVAGWGIHELWKETWTGSSYVQSTIGSGMSRANAVAVDGSGNVYVADAGNNRILRETLSHGSYTQSVLLAGGTGSFTGDPSGVAVDGSGDFFITSYGSGQILELIPSGTSYLQSSIGSGLAAPSYITVDGGGNLYVADTVNNRIVRETPANGGYTQSVVQSSSLFWPWGVAVDDKGNVYINDSNHNRVLKEDYADLPSLTFATTAVGSESSDSPQSVTVLNDGNADLTFLVPATGDNPSISSGYMLDVLTTCPELTSSSSAATLAAGKSCVYAVDFIPVSADSSSGVLTVTDDNLNAIAPGYAVQTIALSGTGGEPMTLTVTKLGAGTGTVTSSPAGIICGATCSAIFLSPTVVTLTATADSGSSLTSWSGCDSSSDPSCTVSMTEAKTVTATFVQLPPATLTVTKQGSGTGTVTSSPTGISCGATCSASFANPTLVSLTATADTGSGLAGWSGCDASSGITCTVTMNQARTVTATFSPLVTLTVTKQGLGTGTVSSSPAGINCGATCSGNFLSLTAVTLTAAADSGSELASWSGCDSSAGISCTVNMTQARSVAAKFSKPPFGAMAEPIDATTRSSSVAQAGDVLITGWAADPQMGAPVSQVSVLIDGAPVGNATLGIAEPGVVTKYNNFAYYNAGWTFTYPAAGLAVGSHQVAAVLTDSLGLTAQLRAQPFSVAAAASYGSPFGALGQAIDAATRSTTVATGDNLLVTGWAADPHDGAPVSSVSILIDGAAVGTATLGIARPDVAAAQNNPHYLNSGWTFTMAGSGLSTGAHTVSATASDSAGQSALLGSKTITVAATSPDGPPFGSLGQAVDAATGQTTVSQTDNLLVEGWAADVHDGAPVSQVSILIDGTAVGNATLDIAQHNLAKSLGSRYMNAGWKFTMGAASLSAGTHTVTAVASDSLGLSTQFQIREVTVTP